MQKKAKVVEMQQEIQDNYLMLFHQNDGDEEYNEGWSTHASEDEDEEEEEEEEEDEEDDAASVDSQLTLCMCCGHPRARHDFDDTHSCRGRRS